MADAPYLVALALLEIRGKRALPLAGRSLSATAAAAGDPGDDGKGLALELMLRLWQRSDEGPIQRVAGDDSLLLVEMPLEVMSEQLPLLKASWIAGGETGEFMENLHKLTLRGCCFLFAKYEPISYKPWP
ncbi:MAG: hypothetical protein FJ083_06730 [Cyanobacteria bacterium K_Offshore_surface_m2_239]|nr:hypothetical protein [Cyanobacteria bacterium K_Offshore_surface_m2_239]